MEQQKITLEKTQQDNYFYSEAIKTLRTNIQFCGSGIQVVMFTSSLPNEGKSETTLSLAESLGSIGKRTLLIDADMRKSVFAARYGIKGKINGLSQYLCGQKTREEVIYATNIENVDFILAGPYSPNPAELLEDPLFKELIEAARKDYDYVVYNGRLEDAVDDLRAILRAEKLKYKRNEDCAERVLQDVETVG